MKTMMGRGRLLTTFLLLVGTQAVILRPVYADDDVAKLKTEVAALEGRINQLERQLADKAAPPPRISPGPVRNDWDPLMEMEQLQSQMNRLFNASVGRGQSLSGFPNQALGFDPTVDMKENSGDYVLQMDIPGMTKNDINMEIKGRMLVVSGERREDTTENDPNQFYRRERSFGSFSRVVGLPDDAQVDKINAQYKGGVLTVTIPKIHPGQKSPLVKKVEIK